MVTIGLDLHVTTQAWFSWRKVGRGLACEYCKPRQMVWLPLMLWHIASFAVVIHCLKYVILNNVLYVATLCACKLFEVNNVLC